MGMGDGGEAAYTSLTASFQQPFGRRFAKPVRCEDKQVCAVHGAAPPPIPTSITTAQIVLVLIVSSSETRKRASCKTLRSAMERFVR